LTSNLASTGPDRGRAPQRRSEEPPLVQVDNVAISIGEREVISDLTLKIEPGKCLGLVGETGSGKSVTCRLLTGMLRLLSGRTTAGTASFDGIDLLSLTEREWRQIRGRRIGLIPQNSLSGLDPVMTVGRQLVETLRELRPDEDPRRQAAALLEQVQMPRAREVLRSYPHQLSGGMKQRVMIAFGIAGQPDLLVADEPTTALDATVQREILDLLTGLRAERSMSMIFVTHDLGVVSAISDTVSIMYAGTTIESGPTNEVIGRPRHPYTKALLDARPTLEGSDARLKAIPGIAPEPDSWPAGCRFAPRCTFAVARCNDQLPRLETSGFRRLTRCVRSREIQL
jgi:oligopeptide/dipeptide ABC transporter ATP-binding protein